MTTYISILRGINVSGHKKIEMAGLKALYEELKFQNATTYIQSGNVVFKTDKAEPDHVLAKRIEQAILEKYSFQVPVIIRGLTEIEKIISGNSFLKDKNVDIEKLHVTFLEAAADEARIESLKTFDYSPDKFIIAGKEIFLYCPGGYGNTKLSNNFFENKLKVSATTRNWKTVNKLLELAKQL